MILGWEEDFLAIRFPKYGKQLTAKGFQYFCYWDLSYAHQPTVVRAPGTIPANETICVAVSPFAAEIFGCYAKILVHGLKSMEKVGHLWPRH